MKIPGIGGEFSQCAAEHYEHTALWSADGTITYRDLDRQSSALADWLRTTQTPANRMVGIMLPKSIQAVICILASLKAGVPYVPIDPTWPARRRDSIFRQSNFDVLLTRDKFIDATDSHCTVLSVESDSWTETINRETNYRSAATVDASDLAYILYTSGSTGDPKGVCVSNRAAHYFPAWARTEFSIDATCKIASIAPFTFDLSTFDLFSGLCGGATVYLVPEMTKMLPSGLSRFLQDHEITTMYAVPSNLGLLATRGVLERRNLNALRTVLFAGEVFPLPLFREFCAKLPKHVRYANLYGPTETNVCTWFDTVNLTATDSAIPIGIPLPEFQLFTLQTDGTSRSASADGELCAIGPGVMSGYRGHETESCWAPKKSDSEAPAYRTGDLVAQRSDGNWEYKGRIDNMVKIWGYRVELGEIESCLLSVDDIEQAAVVKVSRNGAFADALVGFVVSNDPEADDSGPLLLHCKSNLPSYMRPQSIRYVDKMPLSHNGKIERKVLESLANESAKS